VQEGLDQLTKAMIEFVCQGGFLSKNSTKAWEFLKDLADKQCSKRPLEMIAKF